ncbi:Conserved_hypothetical protein [Hexamita inflata]|uniref:FHA domain-containing protein n=1 Tax=Hexamita inflata TaxID=28002 RepID=A0AA86UM91_9EUKA|nr:Conserved hypothetical protein [Hexamita inflata]
MQVSSYSLTNETRNLIEQQPVEKNVIQICRSSTTQLDISTQYVYLNNASVSSKHCKVSLNPETNVAEITDNSRNGTIILFQNKEYNIKNETMFCTEYLQNVLQLTVRGKDEVFLIQIEPIAVTSPNVLKQKSPETEPIEAVDIDEEISEPKSTEKVQSPEKKAEKKTKQKKEEGEENKKKETGEEMIAERKTKKVEKKEKTKEVKEIQSKKVKVKAVKVKEPKENLTGSKSKEDQIMESSESYASVVNDMLVSDDEISKSSEIDNTKEESKNEPLVFDPHKFFTEYESVEEQEEGEGEQIEDEQFKNLYPTVIIPNEQVRFNFDYCKQMRDLDFYQANVWTSDLTQKQIERLTDFEAKIQDDYNPENIMYFICNQVRRTARFLIALASGIPIIDGSTLDIQSNIKKANTMKYTSLRYNLFNPSVQDVIFNNATKETDTILQDLIKDFYSNYSLPFVSSQLQVHRLLCPYKYVFMGLFSVSNELSDEEDLRFLLGLCYFINQLGAKCVIVTDPSKDILFKGPLIRTKQFKNGVVRALIGRTVQERFNAYSQQIENGCVFYVNKPEITTDVKMVDKAWFVRSAFLGEWVEEVVAK